MLKKNQKVAFKWFSLAARQGDSEAIYNIAWMYQHGKGTTQDNIKAYKWYSVAALLGTKDATFNKDILVKKMTRENITIAKKLVQICVTMCVRVVSIERNPKLAVPFSYHFKFPLLRTLKNS